MGTDLGSFHIPIGGTTVTSTSHSHQGHLILLAFCRHLLLPLPTPHHHPSFDATAISDLIATSVDVRPQNHHRPHLHLPYIVVTRTVVAA